jgi:exopolysaccharide production protein ExoQ
MSATLTAIPTGVDASRAQTGDPLLFKRTWTWWLMLALLLLADEGGIFKVAGSQGKSLANVRQYYDVSSTLLMLCSLAMCAIGSALILNRLVPTLRLMLEQKAVLAFAILAFLSVSWSQEPQFTFKMAMWLFFAFVFAWLFASCYPPADQMRLLLVAGIIIALSSTAMAILLPRYGLDLSGEWKGVLGQKNNLGHAILFLFSGLAYRPIRSSRQLWTVALLAMLALGLILMSGSKGSLVLTLLLVAVRFYGPFLKSRRRDQIPFVLFATIFTILGAVFGREIIFSLLGRDSTLSGRTHEWSVLSFYALRHLWLGYGYQAFWTGTGDSLHAMKTVGGAMHGSDSGYLDTMLQFGLAGMVLWLVVALVTARDFAKIFRREYVPPAAYWYIGIILATFVGSFTDGFFPGGGVPNFIFVVACAGLRSISVGTPPTRHVSTTEESAAWIPV